eukprot:scaffold86382_cov63-Phaeocystis_antarctica.AAC.1
MYRARCHVQSTSHRNIIAHAGTLHQGARTALTCSYATRRLQHTSRVVCETIYLSIYLSTTYRAGGRPAVEAAPAAAVPPHVATRSQDGAERPVPGWSKAVESAALEAAGASSHGSGRALSGPASSWERRAAQSRQARPEEAQAPSWGAARLGEGTLPMLPCLPGGCAWLGLGLG